MVKATQMTRHIGTRMDVRFMYRSQSYGRWFGNDDRENYAVAVSAAAPVRAFSAPLPRNSKFSGVPNASY
jgi:hypothetical protein